MPTPDEVRDVLRLLRATPKRFSAVAAMAGEPAEGWSLNEVLAHLRGAADVQGGWIERILTSDGPPTIRYASPRTGMRKGRYAEVAYADSLRAFRAQRAALVERLRALPPADWLRSATFTGTTPGWSPTVFDIAHGIGTHELSHGQQIAALALPG